MDFDIDAVLDQLEKTLNHSDQQEKKETNQNIQVTAAPRKSVDELLLLDLDPLSTSENLSQDNEDKLERLKQDLESLYASSIIVNTPSAPIAVLPDVTSQQEDLLSKSLPLVVEQLELEVRQEILHHTTEQSSPDLATAVKLLHEDTNDPVIFSISPTSRDDEQAPDSLSSFVVEETQTKDNLTFRNEPDFVEHESHPVLHSVDSIVNAHMSPNLDDYIASSPLLNENEMFQPSADANFAALDESDEKSMQSTSEQVFVESSNVPPSMPSLTKTLSDTNIQDFDLVKNVLSDIFDRNADGELLDENPIEEKETELVNIEQQEISSNTNNDEDFRFLDDMLASIDGFSGDVPQLTVAEIDRVDSILKEIVNAHQATESTTPAVTNEIEPIPYSPSPVTLEQRPSSEQIETPPSDTPQTTAVPLAPIDEELLRVEQEWARLTEEDKTLGSIAPEWVSDDQAPVCMKCATKFSITRRRHHCRACGKVFCSACCSHKIKLIYDDNKEDRACNDCIQIINHVEYLWNYMRNNQKPRSSVLRKKSGPSGSSTASGTSPTGKQGSDHKKSVTFDDGVKPGVEANVPMAAAAAASNIMSTNKLRSNETNSDQVSLFKPEPLTNEELEEKLRQLKDPNEPPVKFRIHSNLTVISKLVNNFEYYLNRNGGYCWIFASDGLCTVAQDELIFIFDEDTDNANDIITDILVHIHQIYCDATKGSFVRHLGLSLSSNPSKFLGSQDAIGFLYVSEPTSTYNLFPEAPYLFGILIHRLELSTAQCFPMRLLIRLGYEYQTYLWPLFNIINRNSMFLDTQHTIMSLLCDFRSFTYGLPTVRGLKISIGAQGSVTIHIPRNRHDDILKSLEQSSPHALSFGIMNAHREAHSKHLVTIQNSTDQQYETRVFASPVVQNEQQAKIGGSFLVINASLRSRDSPPSSPLDTQNSGSFSLSTNLNAKVNPIEDGIMLQIDGDALKTLKQCLRERKDYAILAKARSIVNEDQPDLTNGNTPKKSSSEQLVEFLWTDDDNDVNRGIRSPIDHFPMDGIRNSRIHYAGQRSLPIRLRWTDLFFIECYLNNNEAFDPTRLADSLAKAFTQALIPFLDMLREAKCRKLGLRVTIDRENASYIAGSNGEQLSPFFLSQLDDHMIPIVMKASDNVSRAAPSLILELIFYVLD